MKRTPNDIADAMLRFAVSELITERFGPLTRDLGLRLAAAPIEALERYLARLLAAESAAALLAD